MEKNVRSLKESYPGKAYATLKRMGAQPGDDLDDGSFSLLEHLEANLTNKESVDKIAQHFSSISQEFPALNIIHLSETVQAKLKQRMEANLPYVSRYKIENMIRKAKKTKSGVPGDLPKILHKEFGPELALPLEKIYNGIVQTGQWPDSWKVEFGLPLKKTANPLNEDQIRIISLTPSFSKVFERFVISWLMDYLQQHLDWWQYGGQKGTSVTHYLIDFINFISYNQDLRNMHAVLAVIIDFSKAFNRINHAKVIVRLSDWGVPGWLLKILVSYPTDRSMIIRYKGVQSSRHFMPGGSPQGALLGVLLYLVYVSDIGMDLPIIRQPVPDTIDLPSVTFPPTPAVTEQEARLKYVDDLSLAECVRLDTNLCSLEDQSGPR